MEWSKRFQWELSKRKFCFCRFYHQGRTVTSLIVLIQCRINHILNGWLTFVLSFSFPKSLSHIKKASVDLIAFTCSIHCCTRKKIVVVYIKLFLISIYFHQILFCLALTTYLKLITALEHREFRQFAFSSATTLKKGTLKSEFVINNISFLVL